MEVDGKKILVAGAGELGSRAARALAGAGAQVAVTSRDLGRAEALAAEVGGVGIELEVTDENSRIAALDRAESGLGGLDGLFVATGTVAFGIAGEIPGEIEEELIAVNATGPIRLIGSALGRIADDGTVVAITAVVAEYPTAGMAAYSASKSALSAYLTALRRESRRKLSSVIDVRPGHMETGFSDRALAGEPPRMPQPEDPDVLIAAILDAIRADGRELAYDPMKRELQAR